MSRCLSQQHLDAYKKGLLKKLFIAITEDPELSFEIRMNDEATVYYHKKKILTTTFCKDGLKGIQPFDARYCNCGEEKPLPEILSYFDENHRDNTLKSVSLMRKYFAQAKHYLHAHSLGMEFEIQQNIALGNHSFDGRFIVVDMEWMYSQSHIEKGKRLSKTRIDLIIVDTWLNKDGYNDIYLAELKVGMGATQGNSGTIDHVKKTNEIICNADACSAIRDDVQNALSQKLELGLITGVPKKLNLALQPKMMLILAYRGGKEQRDLVNEAEVAKKHALKLHMQEPYVLHHNALIVLN